ncbi:glycosyltransferase family 1 protein [uncultured Lamprocystis sp.]|jgi:glycosyltransferase involved in cell wall biosynthesis|uniref:glycosyltransferase family 1 protein n=1 Tax=uncultured Lamprocystis sp. TaxID=543132 RepID=UPI0025F5D716|nr:glycosyltransferase family 1 protein [uncultured Lamprocystis sp.]
MFLTKIPTLDAPDPETESFGARLTRLGQGTRHVAYFYPRPNTGTFRYRVLNMIEALAVTGEAVGASWFSGAELCYLDAILDRADVIVICHAKYSRALAQLVAKARARRKRVLYDVDDLVFDDRYVHLILNYLDHSTDDVDFNYWFADFGRYGALMKLCDGVVVTNKFLADRAREFSGLPMAVIPNFMNRLQLEHSARILAEKCASGFARDGYIHVGYFSGSPTHRRDFAVVEDALLALMDADPRVVLLIVGFLDPGSRFARFGERVEVFPLQNILNLQRAIGEVEINLIPLQDNIFTNCKSELKVFEASAVGTISIGSPTFTLNRAISDGITGFVAPAHLWGQALARAIDRLDSYPDMAMAAAHAALRCYVPDVQGPVVLRALFGDLVDT